MHTETTAADAAMLTELQPDLEILRPLGSGDTARVYLARESALQRLVAVKVLKPDVAMNTVARQRFEREAQSAARISHPNVTAIYRVGRLSGDVPYMVMEYIDGRTLDDVMQSGSTFDYAQACTMLATVASALAAAHDQGIIHRDVRPQNVFVENRTTRAVLGDFGLAALLESGASSSTRITAVGVRLGQMRYMSPEQIRGEPVTEQSDVYSFAIVAFEVLAGRGPFEATGDAKMMAAHLQAEPLRLRDVRPDVDSAVAQVIERCLSKDANRRPRAREIARLLGAPAGSTQAVTPASASDEYHGPLGQLMDELRRRRVYRMLVAYGAFALAIFGVMQGIGQAFPVSRLVNQVLVVSILAGFPLALMLSWAYDIGAGGIRRTRSVQASGRARALMWIGLATSVVIAVLLARFMLQAE